MTWQTSGLVAAAFLAAGCSGGGTGNSGGSCSPACQAPLQCTPTPDCGWRCTCAQDSDCPAGQSCQLTRDCGKSCASLGTSGSSSGGGSTGTGAGSTGSGGSTGSATGGTGSGSSGSGGNALSGPQAFTVASAVFSTGEPSLKCGYLARPSGLPTAASVILSPLDLTPTICSNVPYQGGPIAIVDVQITTPDAGGLSVLVPGTYPIGNENVADDDLCMLPPGTGAILDVRDVSDGGVANVWSAISGTVTLDAVGAASLAGSFDVVLGQVDQAGNTISTTVTSPLAGTFAAPACSGDGGI